MAATETAAKRTLINQSVRRGPTQLLGLFFLFTLHDYVPLTGFRGKPQIKLQIASNDAVRLHVPMEMILADI